jgi:hypothetical protein
MVGWARGHWTEAGRCDNWSADVFMSACRGVSRMTRQQHDPNPYHDAIESLRRLARAPYETPPELLRLRHRIRSERTRTHRSILERISQQAHVDLEPILQDARRRNAAKRRYVTDILKKLESRAAEFAKQEKTHFHAVRAQYLKGFGRALPLAPGTEQLKFQQPIQWSGNAQPSACNDVFGSMCGTPDFGSFDATADIDSSGTVGIWLYPYISSDNGDCEDTPVARTTHELTYQMGPPTKGSFAVDSVRVDLIGNGLATSSLGDFSGLFVEADPLYEHSFVKLDVYISQQISGSWQSWPLLSDTLFTGKGNYVRQIRSVLSGQTYPVSVVIRKPDLGAGDVLCYVQVECSALAIGSDGRVGINFSAPDHGIFVGGVALIGTYV